MFSHFFLGLLTLSTTVAFSASEPDRIQRHAERLAGLDLAGRFYESSATSDRASLASSVEDQLISTSVSPARFVQDNARVVALSDGGWLAVWYDGRRGSRKIFWQRFDSQGNRVGENQLAAGSSAGADYVDPEILADTLGRIYLFYRNQTHGLIYGIRYTANLEIDLPEFLVNDTGFASFAGPYDFAVFPDGRMVIVWENYSALGSTIEMRLYTPSGVSLLGPVTVNSDGGSASHWVPSVAVAPGSGYLVAWEDYRNGQADIFARQFTGAGNPLGGDFALVPPPNDAAPQYSPQVSYSSKDGYLVGWVDRRLGQEIFLQRIHPTLGMTGGNVLISEGDMLKTNSDLSLSGMSDGKTLAVWAAFGAENSILGLTLDSGLAPVGTPTARNLGSTGHRWQPSAAFDTLDNHALVWTEFIDDDADINLMLFDSLGVRLLTSEVTVNDDQTGAPSTNPFIIASTDWWNLVCFADRRNDAGDIFLRAIANSGSLGQIEQRVNQDAGFNLQSEPSAAVSAARALVVWTDSRAISGVSGQRIYGRFASLLGDLTGDEFLISDSTATAVKASPRAVMNSDGRALVVWVDHRDGTAQLFGRWLATDGGLDGDEFAVSDPGVDLSATDLHVGLSDADQFYVIWLDIGVSSPAMKVRWYNSDGSPAGSFSQKSAVNGVDINELAADVEPGGNVVALWTGIQGGSHKAFMAEYDLGGNTVVAPFVLTDDTTAGATDPALSVSPNGYVSAVWIDRRVGHRIVYYQILDASRQPMGVNLPVSAIVPEFMQTPATDAFRGRAWFSWADPRDNGLNIYAANVIYLPTDVGDDDSPVLPSGYYLSQNYPNPFNPATVISFTLPSRSNITLTVFNLLGQEVNRLSEGVFPAGEHLIIWDGTDNSGKRAASGVYLYKLHAGDFSHTRKMMLLK